MHQHPKDVGIDAAFGDLVGLYLVTVAAAAVLIWILASVGIESMIFDENAWETAARELSITVAHSNDL